MTISEHKNWIGGEWCRALAEARFETQAQAGRDGVSSSASGGKTERWPRSSEPDLEAAWRALSGGLAEWSRLPPGERMERLRCAHSELSMDSALAAHLGESFGLREAEAAAFFEADLFHGRQALEILSDAALTESPAPGVFLAHWTDLAGRLLARVSAKLLAGHGVLLLGDARLPFAAEAVVRAFERAGVPGGALALVWDDTLTCIDCALRSSDAGWVRLAGHGADVLELARRTRAWMLAPGALWPVRSRTAHVRESDDPLEAAEMIIEQAFGRVDTLSGQVSGHIARVACHQRSFSRFTEALLARLATHPDVREPLPLFEADAAQHLQEAWALGLDEGATPIFGPEHGHGPGPVARPRRSHDGAASDEGFFHGPLAHPTVFTNVEPFQRLARMERPVPLLCLIRARSDAAVADIAAELDAYPPASVSRFQPPPHEARALSRERPESRS